MIAITIKRFFLFFIVMASLFVVAPSFASNYQGVITNVTPYGGTIYVVVANGGFDGAASPCPNGSSMIYSFVPTAPFGTSMLAVLLSAKLTSRLVYMYGNGQCGPAPYGGGMGAETLLGVDFKG